MIQAILMAQQGDEGPPKSLLRLCGLTLFERNLRLLRHCGIGQITAVVDRGSELIRSFSQSPSTSDIDFVEITGHNNREDLKALCAIKDHVDEKFIQLRADYVYDRRVIDIILSCIPNTFLVDSSPPFPSTQRRTDESATRDRNKTYFYGLNLLNRSFLDRLAREADLCDQVDPARALEKMDSEDEIHYLRMHEISTYMVNLRRSIPLACFTLRNGEDLRLGQDILVDSTQKGTLDLPAQYLHPIPENWIVRRLLNTRVTPNQVTLLSNLIAFIAIGLFWQGRLALGVFLALTVGILDGVDGKLARLKLLYSRIGDRFDHILDLIYEPLWYLAIGDFLSGETGNSTPLKLSIGIVIFYFLDRLATGLFKHYRKVELFDFAPADRFFRRIGARRNTNVLILLAGVILGRPLHAIWAIFALTVITAVFHIARAIHVGSQSRSPHGNSS